MSSTFKDLVPIGYWYSEKESKLPMPVANSSILSKKDKLKIVNYLSNGKNVNNWRGFANCRICNCRNGSADLSDGIFIWPEGLAHYVSEHNVSLPLKFTNHVLGRCVN